MNSKLDSIKELWGKFVWNILLSPPMVKSVAIIGTASLIAFAAYRGCFKPYKVTNGEDVYHVSGSPYAFIDNGYIILDDDTYVILKPGKVIVEPE